MIFILCVFFFVCSMLQATLILLWSAEWTASGALPPASIFDVLRRLVRAWADFAFRASAKRAVTTGIPSIRIMAVSRPYLYARKIERKKLKQLDSIEEMPALWPGTLSSPGSHG
jgi:hypothetical protein